MNAIQKSHIEAYENGIPIIDRDEIITYKKGKNGRIYSKRIVKNHPLEKRVHFAKYPQLFLMPKINQTYKRMPVYPAKDSILLYRKRKTKKGKPKKNNQGKMKKEEKK